MVVPGWLQTRQQARSGEGRFRRGACDTQRHGNDAGAGNAARPATEAMVELGPAVAAGEPWALTDVYGPGPESSWGPREVLAHVAEMLPFWLGEIERIVDAGVGPGGGEPPAFGRLEDDPIRVAGHQARPGLPGARAAGADRSRGPARRGAVPEARSGGRAAGPPSDPGRPVRRGPRRATHRRAHRGPRDPAPRVRRGLALAAGRPAARGDRPMFMLWAIPAGILVGPRAGGPARQPVEPEVPMGLARGGRACSCRSCSSRRPANRWRGAPGRRSTSSRPSWSSRRSSGTSAWPGCRWSSSARRRISSRSRPTAATCPRMQPRMAFAGPAARGPRQQRRARGAGAPAPHRHLRAAGLAADGQRLQHRGRADRGRDHVGDRRDDAPAGCEGCSRGHRGGAGLASPQHADDFVFKNHFEPERPAPPT